MADSKLTALTATTAPATTDIVYVVTDPGGTPASKKCTIANLKTAMNAVAGPASATDGNLVVFDGTTGKLVKDGGAVETSGWVRLSETVLASPAASIDISSISGSYRHLKLYLQTRSSTSGTKSIGLKFNNDGGANYNSVRYSGNYNNDLGVAEVIGGTSILIGYMPGSDTTAGLATSMELSIPNYSGATFSKSIISLTGPIFATSSANIWAQILHGWWSNTGAINRITLTPSANNFAAGTILSIYGLS